MFVENANSFDLQSRQIKSLFSHIFDTCSLKYVFTVLKSHTNSHYVISQCDDLICLQNDRILNLQIHTCSRKSFASILNSSLDFDSSLDLSKISHSTSICRRCQEHFVIYLSSSWFTSIVSRIESSEIIMRISILREYWLEEVSKVLFFESLTSDSSTLRKSLLWRSSKSC